MSFRLTDKINVTFCREDENIVTYYLPFFLVYPLLAAKCILRETVSACGEDF